MKYIFGLMLMIDGFCFATECLPSQYDIALGNPQQKYCDNLDGGGQCSGTSSWTWVSGKGCKQNAGINERDCPCHGYSCPSGNVRCTCGSDSSEQSTSCYTQTSYCDKCSVPGQYRKDCGCNFTKEYVYDGPFVQGPVETRSFTLQWICSSGTCAACPKGQMCPASNFPTQPTPCPPDTFQNNEGQVSCDSTLCKLGEYNIDYVATFDSKAFKQNCVVCDKCTKAGLVTGVSQQRLCPLRDETMGMIGNVCAKCLSCLGKTYAMVEAAEEFCLKDIKGCIEQYYDNAVPLGPYPQENDQADATLFKIGAIPWKPRFMRTEPLYRNVAGKEGVGRRGMVPYYTPCADGSVYSGRYRPRTHPNLVAKMNSMSWYDDCSPLLTRECNPNHYAVLSGEVFEDGFLRLLSCEQCQENTDSTSTGGLATACPCKTGFASQKTLTSKFGRNNVFMQVSAENGAMCIDCSRGVYWRHNGSNLVWQEALVCLEDTVDGVKSCIGGENFNVETGKCVQCPMINPGNIQTIPNTNRIGCRTCGKGTRNREGTDGFTCEECVPNDDGKYQDLEGQAECKHKKERCEVGFYLVVNYDNDRDNECKLCPLDCGPGQITIMSPNKTKFKDTCDGNKHSFFGCFDEGAGGALGVSPDKRLVYTSIDQGNTRATVETCDIHLLPSDAEWVSYRTPNAVGAECYFACLHGVNHAVSQTLNSLILSHVYSERQDLIDHLVSNSQGLTTSMPLVANINANTMWTLGLSGYTSTSSKNWNVHVQQPVSSSINGVIHQAFSSNTFLFIDKVMRSFNLSSLCVPAETAYSVPCLDGYVKPVGWMNNLKCAWHARTNLFRNIQQQSISSMIAANFSVYDNSSIAAQIPDYNVYSVACMGAVSTATQCSEICQSENGDLSRFRAGCTENCLDRHLKLASMEQESFMPSTQWYNHLAWIKYFLQASAWSGRAFGNPYIMIDSGSSNNCLFRCSSPATFRYSTQNHISSTSIWVQGSQPLGDFAACIPCSLGQQICSEFNPPRYFLSNICGNYAHDNGGRELTTADVCSSCDQEKPNAVIISPGSDRYGEWLTSRLSSTDSRYSITDGSGNRIWGLVLCRYTCNAGYTSTRSSPEAYNNAPCTSCDDARPQSCKNNTDRGLYKTTSMICGEANNFMPYTLECALCNAGTDQTNFIFFAQENNTGSGLNNMATEPYASRGDCLALCNVNIYHSVRKTISGSEIVYVETPIPFKDLECHLCARNPSRPCGAEKACPSSGFYYQNASATSEAVCVGCNTSPCPPDYYREMCIPGFIHDAQCVPCPESSLYNDPDSNHFAWWSPPLLDAVQENQNRITRKWIYGEVGGMSTYPLPFSQCKVACINNYAWVNLSSGLSPIPSFSGNLAANLYCLPCIGSYISSGLMPGTNPQLLYSFWNSTNTSADVPATVPGTALHSMMQVLGGCYTCPGGGIRDVVSDSRGMCEIRAGKTENNQGSYGVAIISPQLSVSGIVDVPDFTVMDWNGAAGNVTLQQRRRRMLSIEAATAAATAYNGIQNAGNNSNIPTVKLVRVRLQPLVANGDYFTCCSKLSRVADRQDCQRQWMANLEGKKNMEGQNWGVNYCLNANAKSNGRRLLLAPTQSEQMSISLSGVKEGVVELDDAGTCFSGTYKEERGQGPCYVCPAGSSTSYPYSGATNRSLCMCMPGYYSIRNMSTKSLLHCEPCGHNYSRGPLSQNDSVCFPCAENSYAPTPTSSYCYCNPGTYRNSTTSGCVFCEPGFYCSNNLREACPPNSMSAAKASSRGECICDSKGYYGALVDVESQCIPSPPGLMCMVSGMGALLSCSCAPGWSRLIDSFQVGDARGTMVLRAHCESPCTEGQYAVLSAAGDKSIKKCVACPENSYSSSSQAIEYPGKSHLEQCTPCPLNSNTGGKTGVKSILDCSCSSNNGSVVGCGICEGGSYMEPKGCVLCPSGTTSTPGGNGIQACLCPPGNRAVKVFSPDENHDNTTSAVLGASLKCEPCPRGYFSRNVGLSCTPCGKGLTTALSGSRSLRDCI